ncbi:MAG TPA: sigma 54-interacting transcriptional regulator [Vicinamibacteria bacterium]|nr:sigma 54-interacting transcriptional regulator [Vicinamibacteria bacterium]
MSQKDEASGASPSESETETLGLKGALPGRAPIRQFRLRVLDGPSSGLTFTSSRPRTVLGKYPSADFVLKDPTVSRFHCELEIEGDQVVVRDLKSRNGTFVDGTKVLVCWLHDGATLKLGQTKLRFELRSEPVLVPLSTRVRFGSMVGHSLVMREAFAVLELAAKSNATLLLRGETGTGKDLAAESVHFKSGRSEGPFVVVDCAAIPANLLESQLFGYQRGAFTGADRDHVGAVETASGGTLFLDEVAELSLDLQPKLLRVLEQRAVQRLGSNQQIPVDVRIIAATNRNLREEVNAQRFRSDLFYRLAVVELVLPPLRKRTEDIPLLVGEILGSFETEDSSVFEEFRTSEFFEDLARHTWPGNVRELRNYLERCALLGTLAPPVDEQEADNPPPIDVERPLSAARQLWLQWFEKRYLEALLRKTDDNVSAAARLARVDRAHFHRLLCRSGLR